jgi:beta-barrel assembly-enhancing protease
MIVTVKAIESSEVNAFALPGGFLYVNRGLIEAVDNEAELAGVIAHEVAHIAARHGVEQATKGEIFSWATLPVTFLGGFMINQAAEALVPMMFLKFSRNAEREADRLAAQYLWKTGYDPHALITFFEKLKAQEKRAPGSMPRIFRTHPMNDDRIKDTSQLVARFPEKKEYQVSSSDFITIKELPGIKKYKWDLAPPKDSQPRSALKRRKGKNKDKQPGKLPERERPTLGRLPGL